MTENEVKIILESGAVPSKITEMLAGDIYICDNEIELANSSTAEKETTITRCDFISPIGDFTFTDMEVICGEFMEQDFEWMMIKKDFDGYYNLYLLSQEEYPEYYL